MGKEPKSRRHACPQCDYKARDVTDLSRHVRTVHEQRREHACTQCKKAFGQAGNLRVHVRAVHEQRRDHACPQCYAAFGSAGHLSRHVRTVHNAAAEKKKKARGEVKAKKAKALAARIAENRKNSKKSSEVNKVLHKRARAQAESFERRMYENQEQMTEQERALLAIRPAFVASNRNNSSYYAARSDVSMVKNWVAAVPAFIPFFG
jgi:uncharacterized C2H2 Zn-finger protein